MRSRGKDLLLIIAYIMFGVLTRTVWHIAPNVEFVTALSLAGAYFIRNRYSMAIPLGIMLISDFIIGNTAIYLFTWAAFLVAYFAGRTLNKWKARGLFKRFPRLLQLSVLSELGGIAFTLFFYLWTNFGVVVVSSLYPRTFEGLMLSYKMGLPFLMPQLIGNAIIVPTIFILTDFVYKGNFNVLERIKVKVWSKN
jgi:hypothetical protein